MPQSRSGRDRYFLLTTLGWQKPDGMALQSLFGIQKVMKGDKRLKGEKKITGRIGIHSQKIPKEKQVSLEMPPGRRG